MDVDVKRNISEEIPQEEYSIDFEVSKTPVRLGKSDRVFYMDFNDTNFPVRLQEARKDIADFLESKKEELGVHNLSDLTPKEHSFEEIEKTLALKKEIENYIREKINYMFTYDVCNDVFGLASVVSVTAKGEYHFDNFLNCVLPLVEKEYGIRIKATNEKVKAYLDKKGMHPALRK